MTPALMARIAARNGVAVPDGLVTEDGARFRWDGSGTAQESLSSFVAAYDVMAGVIRAARDYEEIVHDYLVRAAAEGCIYAEITISPDHAKESGVGYPAMCAALERGYARAKAETGMEARFISTAVRHYGPARALAAGEETGRHPHPLVTAFGLAGDENAGTFRDFLPAFEASGLQNRTAYAGEAAGAASVREAMNVLGARRFGHMVRAAEDPVLLEDLRKAGAVPEVCVSSNMMMRVFNDHAAHPLRLFFDRGLKVVLGSDDPVFFRTSIGNEYRIAHEKFGFTEEELRRVTRNAVEAAFVDEVTRERLLHRLAALRP